MERLPTLWVLKHGIKNESGVPIEFERHRFMYDLYNDLSPLQVILKPPQIGATVKDIIKSFWVAKKLGKDIIYTLPTSSDVTDMAGGKINRLIAQNPILKEWVKEHDTVEQKSVGNNIIHYRGTWTTRQAMMVSSQLNIHDEVDASNADVITQYETRLQAQTGGWRWYFSHPSLAGHGVDIYWQKSDKKEWHIECEHCKHEQILTYPDNIDPVNKQYICSNCKQPISDETRVAGEWKKTSEGDFSGYHISQLMCPWITAEDILLKKNDPMKDEQYFHNYVLGLPYVGGDDKITKEQVLKNVVNQVNDQQDRIIIGVDTGLPIYFTCLNKKGVFYYGRCRDSSQGDPYQDLEALLKRWDNSIIVSDQGGDLIGIRNLQQKYPGRVFLAYYRKDRKSQKLVDWGEGDEYGTVRIDRNRTMQWVVESLRDPGRILLQGSQDDWQEFASQFENIYREKILSTEAKDRDSRTLYGDEYVWKRKGPDHWCHALLYALVGLDKYPDIMARVVGSSGLEDIPTGRNFDL